MKIPEFKWRDQGSEPGDDQVCVWNGYKLHAVQFNDEVFYCAVYLPDEEVFHNTWGIEIKRIFPMSWQSARHLCEMVAIEHWIKTEAK